MAKSKDKLTDILARELAALENIHGQNPDTGKGVGTNYTYLGQYTTRMFGSPFQLIDSVDKRFENINKRVGNEYLRNFTLNSPILHIKPGMPVYTGGDSPSAIVQAIQANFINKDASDSGTSYDNVNAFLDTLAKATVFGKGDRLQRRMYGFRETYFTYMQYVNYMCRSMATFLNLTNTDGIKLNNTGRYPVGCLVGEDNEISPFKSLDWSKYRWLSKSKPSKPSELLGKLAKNTTIGATIKAIFGDMAAFVKAGDAALDDLCQSLVDKLYGVESDEDIFKTFSKALEKSGNILNEQAQENAQYFNDAASNNWLDIMEDKVSSVMFMVEPTNFEENLRNDTTSSFIESTIDGVRSSLGKEVAFITQSNTDLGLIDNLVDFLGDTIETAGSALTKLTEGLTGGFMTNMFHGAVQSLKGQKMIYPEIYDKSNSETNYNFTVNLTTPYGDDYNYFMEIIVPLMHLIGLAAPRMITANAVASPFLVQAWIPGQATCQLGIISNMTIIKNPNGKHVSVHGFPLEVKVQFTVRELYNALSISPANDPASFMYNETLNDYMANLGGLCPSTNTYKQQRQNMFQNFNQFFENGEIYEDLANSALESVESFWNPFISEGN